MKQIIIIVLFVNMLNATQEQFKLITFNFSMENDADVDTDFGYTHGGRVSALFYRGNTQNSFINIPFTASQNTNNFISFAYANQMFTPYDLDEIEIIKDDRPYAGYSYMEIGLHQTEKTYLDSLTLQIGIVGSSSGMESLQTFLHENIDARDAKGWEYQLKDEFILQLNYMHKWRFEYSKIYSLERVLIPYSGINIGNASLKASAGFLYRIGFNIPKDFGMNSMNEGSFSSLPTDSKFILNDLSKWSFSLNITAGTNLVLKDIFLEDWYDIDRKYFNGYIAPGITLRYKNFSIDYQHNWYTKDYEQRGLYREYKGYGSLIFSYSFD